MSKVISCGVFYKNDLPGGFGFTITDVIFPDINEFVKRIVPFAQNWLDATADRGDSLEEYLDDVEKQCQEISDARNGKGGYDKCGDGELQELAIAISLVETLVQFGRIPNDEFNGIIWGAEGRPFITQKLVSRHKEVV